MFRKSEEMKRHGVELAGPAAKLSKAGKEGEYVSNIERDMIRSLNRATSSVPGLLSYHYRKLEVEPIF